MSKDKMPEVTDIEYWQNEMPIGSRVSWGVWGRGTVVETEIKTPVYGGHPFFSTVVKFDGDRHELIHRGTCMTPREARKLKDGSHIRFGAYARGREKPYTFIKYGDTVRYGDGYRIDTQEYKSNSQIYIVKGGVYDGKIHKNYLVPDLGVPWCEASLESGVWVDNDELTTESRILELVDPFDPYNEREGSEPDSVDILIRDRLSNEEHMKQRRKLETLFSEEFGG